MPSFLPLLYAVTLAASVFSSPVTERSAHSVSSAPFRRLNGTVRGLATHDRTRAAALRRPHSSSKFSHGAISTFATNVEVSYVVRVNIGSPSTSYDLIVDTGSSNTWVGADKKFVKSKTTVDTNVKVAVQYGSGSFSGEEFTDTVSIASGLTIPKQSIGVASNSVGFAGVDGILGLGPVAATAGTLSNNKTAATVTDNLFAQKSITQNLVAISFQPTGIASQANGVLTFGGTDSRFFTGSIHFAPLTKTFPSSVLWGIDASASINGQSILGTTAGIVDTGTTLVLLATNAFQKYQSASGGTLDANTGLIKVTSAQFAALKPLDFSINGQKFSLVANAQIWPRKLNTDIGGVANAIYLIVGDVGENSGSGLDFILGMTFLERFYSVYDTANRRVGLAATPHTTSNAN